MKGNNVIILNHVTMKEAVQMYLDSKFKESEGEVSDVKETVSDMQEKIFQIKLKGEVSTES